MVEPVNKIYFKLSDFDSLGDMYEAIFTQELALVKNQYMCLTYKSLTDNNIYVLEFASLNPMFNQGKLLPCWITPEEARAIAQSRLEYYADNEIDDVINDALKLDVEDKNSNNGNGNKGDA